MTAAGVGVKGTSFIGDSPVGFVLRFLGRGVTGSDGDAISGIGCSMIPLVFSLAPGFPDTSPGGCDLDATFEVLRFFAAAFDLVAFSYLATPF